MSTKIFPMKLRRADKRPAPEVDHDDHVNAWLARHVAPKKVKPPHPPRPKPRPIDPAEKMQEELDRILREFPHALVDYPEILRWIGVKDVRNDYARIERRAKAGCRDTRGLKAKMELFLVTKALAFARLAGRAPVDYGLSKLWALRIAGDEGTDLLDERLTAHEAAIRARARGIIRTLGSGGREAVAERFRVIREQLREDRRKEREVEAPK